MKKRTLRFLGWTLLILSLALSLSACSSGKKDAPAPTDTPAPAGSARPGGAYSALRNAWLLDSPVYADLNGRQSDAFGVIHGVLHIVDQLCQPFIEFFDRAALFAQHGVPFCDNVS